MQTSFIVRFFCWTTYNAVLFSELYRRFVTKLFDPFFWNKMDFHGTNTVLSTFQGALSCAYTNLSERFIQSHKEGVKPNCNNPIVCNSYHNNDKVQPTPCIGEVFDKAKSQPFDTHFQKENHSKNSIHVIQNILQSRALFQVDILKSLKISKIDMKISQ